MRSSTHRVRGAGNIAANGSAPASIAAARAATGYERGTITPFGSTTAWPVVADASLTGRENVALFARLFDVPRRDRAAAVDAVLGAMGLAESADRTASTYSGGMVRRLELAQALDLLARCYEADLQQPGAVPPAALLAQAIFILEECGPTRYLAALRARLPAASGEAAAHPA